MGSGSQPTTTNTVVQQANNQPAEWVQNTGKNLSNAAQNLRYVPYSPYPWIPMVQGDQGFQGVYQNLMTGATMGGLTDVGGTTQYVKPPFTSMMAQQPTETTEGLAALTARAKEGNPILNAAQTNLSDTLAGKYLSADSNPYLSGMFDAASRQVMQKYNESAVPQTDAMFNRAGAFGGSAHRLYQAQQARDMQQGLGDMASQLYGGQYESERQKQLQAAMLGPQISQADYYDIQALLSGGDIKRQEEQNKINEQVNYWQTMQNWPYQQMGQTSSWVTPTYQTGGTTASNVTSSTGTNPYYVNPASKAMGGIATGVGTGAMLGLATGNPIIGALGGLTGLLGGLF
jgi:hypothetical protein